MRRHIGFIFLLMFATAATASAAPQAGATSAFHQLLQREWNYELEHSPTYASVLGDRRWNDRWDDRSVGAIKAQNQHDTAVLSELAAIDRSQLSPEDQLSFDLFRRNHQAWIEEFGFKWYLLPTSHVGGLPEGVRQPPGIQTAYQLAAQMRFATVKDYQDWIARMNSFPAYVEQITTLMREGVRQHMVHPRVILERIPAQIEKQIVKDPAQSGFYAPFTRMPEDIPEAERKRLAILGWMAVRDNIVPALQRFLAFLKTEYIPAAPEHVGIWQMPQGDALYAFFVRDFTTTPMSPDQVHELGLSEVKRIRAEMEQVMARTGFRGSMREFFQFLRTDPRFYYKTGDDLLLHYRNLAKQIDPRLTREFKTLPRMPYGVEPTPEAMAPDVTTGFYYPAAEDGSRAGTYLVNLYRPETRPKWEMVPLTLHEAVPGHHLQTSLAAEQTDLPAFRRFGYYMAFGEGWALYCETLGDELRLYDDPYDKFGQLAYEMWRASRLVVDTGMHAKHWTRQQAIDFMLENSPRQELDITNEVDRYIASPGQALAYKIGQMKIRELRTRAEKALGPRFDVREFHDAVLLDGSLPMDVLETKVDHWIATQKQTGR